jgi:hypothetical protein
VKSKPSVQGTLGIKRQERDADNPPTSIAKEHTSTKLQFCRSSICTSETVAIFFTIEDRDVILYV